MLGRQRTQHNIDEAWLQSNNREFSKQTNKKPELTVQENFSANPSPWGMVQFVQRQVCCSNTLGSHPQAWRRGVEWGKRHKLRILTIPSCVITEELLNL